MVQGDKISTNSCCHWDFVVLVVVDDDDDDDDDECSR